MLMIFRLFVSITYSSCLVNKLRGIKSSICKIGLLMTWDVSQPKRISIFSWSFTPKRSKTTPILTSHQFLEVPKAHRRQTRSWFFRNRSYQTWEPFKLRKIAMTEMSVINTWHSTHRINAILSLRLLNIKFLKKGVARLKVSSSTGSKSMTASLNPISQN